MGCATGSGNAPAELHASLPSFPMRLHTLGASLRLTLIALPATCLACLAPASRNRYNPRTRDITITTVPLLSRELQSTYPFLKQDFAPTGMMPGQEAVPYTHL